MTASFSYFFSPLNKAESFLKKPPLPFKSRNGTSSPIILWQLGFAHVHVLFQPHRYSRAPLFTEVLKDDFGRAFDAADAVTFMDVYPAGEAPVPGVSGKTFLNVVLDHAGHPEAAYVPRRIEVVPYLAGKLGEGDLLITMGAGDVTAIGPQLVDALSQADGVAARRQA